MIRLEQDEYIEEGVEWQRVPFPDNAMSLALIEARPGKHETSQPHPVHKILLSWAPRSLVPERHESTWSGGLLDSIDEEGRVPRGSESGLVEKLRNCKSPCLSVPPGPDGKFTVSHYAGDVTYSAAGLLERNRDSMPGDMVRLFQASSSSLVRSLFAEETSGPTSGKEGKRGRSPGVGVSVGAQFRSELGGLMDAISGTSPLYVRCVNPNDGKAAFGQEGAWDEERVATQLRCSGLLGAMTVTRSCYPVRYAYQECMRR